LAVDVGLAVVALLDVFLSFLLRFDLALSYDEEVSDFDDLAPLPLLLEEADDDDDSDFLTFPSASK